MSLALDVFFAKRQLRYGNDCPNVFPDDYEPPAMEPVKVDWTWLERYSLEKLSGDELLAIWEQLGSHNGCRGMKDIIRRRLKQIGKRVRLGRRRKAKTLRPPKSPDLPKRAEYVPIVPVRTIIPKRDVVRAKLLDLLSRRPPQFPPQPQVQDGDIVQTENGKLTAFRYNPASGSYDALRIFPSP